MSEQERQAGLIGEGRGGGERRPVDAPAGRPAEPAAGRDGATQWDGASRCDGAAGHDSAAGRGGLGEPGGTGESRAGRPAPRSAEARAAALCRAMGAERLRAELTARGVAPVDQAVRLLAGQVRVDLAADEPAFRVVDEAGRSRRRADGEPVSVAELAEEFVEANPHFRPAVRDTGSGARKGGGEVGGVSLASLDANPALKAEFIARHGARAYIRLARRR